MGREFLKGLSVTAVPVKPRLGASAFKLCEKLLLIWIFFSPKCSWKLCLEKCRKSSGGAQLYRNCFKIWFRLAVRQEIKGKVWGCILKVFGFFFGRMVLPSPRTWHLDQKTSRGNLSSNDSCWEPVDFHGKTGKAVEGNSSERGNKTRSLFLPLNSYFSFLFFFNKFLINMYKESQHMKFLLQKREAPPSSQDQEPPGAPGTPSTGPALALVRGKPAQ